MQGIMQKYGAFIFGILFIGIGIFMIFRGNYLVKNCTEKSVATVVNMEERMDNDENGVRYLYYPVVEYKANSETIKTTMSTGSNPPAYSINDKINILYNPNKTTEFIVEGEKPFSIFSYVFIGLGVLITGFGIKEMITK